MTARSFRLIDVPALVRQELARLTSTKLGVLALVALMAVPLLYGGLYLWANRDPQGSLDHLAVAIVDEDEGAVQTDGSVRDHGADIAQRLIDDHSFDWDRVDGSAATHGVETGGYAFAVILPPGFSRELESASGDAPRQARIELRTNDANNAIATQAGQRAVEKLRATIAEEVGDQASLRLLEGLSTVRDGLDRGSSGAGQLADGAAQAVDGSQQLADGAGQLVDGTATASDGAAQLADGLGQLRAGTADLPEQSRRLADGARQVADGNAQIASVADEVGTTAQGLADDLPTLRSDLEQRLRARGLDEATIQDALAAVDPLGQRLEHANATIQAKVSDLDRLSSGAGQVADGAERLAESAPTLADGIAQASDGAEQLADGTSRLHDGAVQLADGTSRLHDGAVQLADGAGTLRDELAKGRDQIPATTDALRASQANTIADPVRIEEVSTAKADSYGEGLAPFFSTLAAWIGIYALFLIVKPFSRRAATAMWSPARVTIAGWLTPALLGAAQMLLLFGILAGILGFRFVHAGATLGLLVLASATFAAIIMALNVWLGSVGQFIGLVLMVVQLVSAGGTFPWQTLPAPLDTLHRMLPMSWSVEALRQTMFGGNLAVAAGDATLLAVVCAASLGLSGIGIARVTSTRTMRDLQPSLIG